MTALEKDERHWTTNCGVQQPLITTKTEAGVFARVVSFSDDEMALRLVSGCFCQGCVSVTLGMEVNPAKDVRISSRLSFNLLLACLA